MRRKLNSLTNLPTMPLVITQVLKALDNPDIPASTLASMIEKDQSLTTRVLRAANSPYYGFSRQISTIELAVVIMGLNSIKEIVIGLVVQKFFARIKSSVFDVNKFWEYSLFSGSCSRLLARKLGYKLAGEAFVAGLMHDLGIIILIEYFSITYGRIRAVVEQEALSLVEAEEIVMDCNHGDVGAWLAEKWNLPTNLCQAIRNHHVPYTKFAENENTNEVHQQLTAIISMSEWFAGELGFKQWMIEEKESPLYLSYEILDGINGNDILSKNSAFFVLKQEMMEEFERASEFNQLPSRSLYN